MQGMAKACVAQAAGGQFSRTSAMPLLHDSPQFENSGSREAPNVTPPYVAVSSALDDNPSCAACATIHPFGASNILASAEAGPIAPSLLGNSSRSPRANSGELPVLWEEPLHEYTVHHASRNSQTGPLNSQLWLSMELFMTVSQVAAAVTVLAISRTERPQAPLRQWVAGYASGCLATLPLLYWRLLHWRHSQTVRSTALGTTQLSTRDLSEARDEPQSGGRRTVRPAHPLSREALPLWQPMPRAPCPQREPRELAQLGEQAWFLRLVTDDRFDVLVERFKMTLDCFFAFWFLVGNVWIFGGHASAAEAPRLFRLCVVFLSLSCIGYAIPFLLCAAVCCCLPCLIALLGFNHEPFKGKGATAAAISALPTCKFRRVGSATAVGQGFPFTARAGRPEREGTEAEDAGHFDDTGVLWMGTASERLVAGEDAMCCICLSTYQEGDELRELPCLHHFHVRCVDTWLKINASCPLCKQPIAGLQPSPGENYSCGDDQEVAGIIREGNNQLLPTVDLESGALAG